MNKFDSVVRHLASFSAVAGATLAATIASSTGCAALLGLDEFQEGSTASSSGGGAEPGTMSSTSGMIPSSSTGVDPGCVGEIADGVSLSTSGILSDACGVFVQADAAEMGTGTSEKPYKSIQEAIAYASGKNVYVCKSADTKSTFSESVSVQDPITVIGGFDCKDSWTWHASDKSWLTAPVDAIPLTILADGVKIANLAITAASANGAGKSSIAVLVSAAEAKIESCDIEAKDAANGADGDPGGPIVAGNVAPASDGSPGGDGKAACSDIDANGIPDLSLPGGAGSVNQCGAGPSVGGDGGKGQQLSGNPGSPGQVGSFGAQGVGEPIAGAWSCTGIEPNGDGDSGDAGQNGSAGPAGKGMGMLAIAGYQGASGQNGTAGKSGQGGGGGGSAKGGASSCQGGKAGAGSSGGGGSAGGCGGGGGKGGKAAGSSIAIASVNSKLTLKDCSLKSGKGGAGGKGGDLQYGGFGGVAGAGKSAPGGVLNNSCAGGTGGTGGIGGTGGGGQGGHSITIAYVGAPVTQVGKINLLIGTPGMGGPGGNGSVQLNVGDPGVSLQQQLFP